MTIRTLIERLEELAVEHGNECQVFVVDDQGEMGFCLYAEREPLGDPARMVVYLDTTHYYMPDFAGREPLEFEGP